MSPSPLGRWWRTLRYLKPNQASAQLRFALWGQRGPVRLEGVPALAEFSPEVPFLPAAAHAHWEPGNRLSLLRRDLDLADPIPWERTPHGPLFDYHLHQFDFARVPDASPGARAELLLDWIARHPSGVGWDPHPISLRAFSWMKLLTSRAAVLLDSQQRARVAESLALQIETLAQSLEVRLQANHLLSNRMAVTLGGLLFEGGPAERWLAQA